MNKLTDIIESAIKAGIDKIYTELPAKVVSYNPSNQTAKVQVTIPVDGVSLPPISSVNVEMSGGADYVFLVEINAGDEGILHVCMRDMSIWNHGVTESSSRQFSLSDSYFSPGVRSQANAIPSVENNGIQMRSVDGKHYVWLKNDGNLHCSGDVYSRGEILTRISHKHPFTGDEGYRGETDEAKQ